MFKLIFKLLFKATLPMVVLAGVIGYGIYMKGGNPMALLSVVGAGFGDQSQELLDNAAGQTQAGADLLKSALGGLNSDADTPTRTRLYRWTDAVGVTHYSQAAPVGLDAELMYINPDVNLIQGSDGRTQKLATQQSLQNANQGVQQGLPGVAGIALPEQSMQTVLGESR